MHYHRTGGNKPALLLGQGITDAGWCWTRFAQDLEQENDVINVFEFGFSEHLWPACIPKIECPTLLENVDLSWVWL